MTVSKCPACNREMTSILPVQDGMTTVCCACLVVMVMEAGKLRMATEEEAADKAPQRQLVTARWIRRLFPPKDVQ